MSTREIPAGAHSRSLAPHSRADTQPVFKTYASAAYEPDTNSVGLPNLAAKRGPFVQALIDTVALFFIALFLCCSAASLPIALFLMFFAQF